MKLAIIGAMFAICTCASYFIGYVHATKDTFELFSFYFGAHVINDKKDV